MTDNPPATTLFTRAADGDKHAWDLLIHRYAPLTWSICRQYRLSNADAGDAAHAIWLQLRTPRTSRASRPGR